MQTTKSSYTACMNNCPTINQRKKNVDVNVVFLLLMLCILVYAFTDTDTHTHTMYSLCNMYCRALQSFLALAVLDDCSLFISTHESTFILFGLQQCCIYICKAKHSTPIYTPNALSESVKEQKYRVGKNLIKEEEVKFDNL